MRLAALRGCRRVVPKPSSKRLRIFTGKRRRAIRAEVNGDLTPEDLDFATVDDGLEGMAFITAAVQNAQAGGVRAKMPAT
jgi:hypothetical protein